MYLDKSAVKEAEVELMSIKHKTLKDIVQFLRNYNARLNPKVIPQKGAVYIFWWTGDHSVFKDANVNRIVKFKGPNQRPVNITYTDDWLFHRGVDSPIPLYVGKTADNLSRRVGLHL